MDRRSIPALLLVAGSLLVGQTPVGQTPVAQAPAAQPAIDPLELRVSSASYLPPVHNAIGAEVRLVDVLTVVRDGKGHTVPGLTRADFELRDEGKPREVTAFSVQQAAVRTAAAPAAAAPAPDEPAAKPAPLTRPAVRTIALFFDDINSTAGDFLQVRNAALHFLKEGLHPGDRVGIFTTFSAQVLPFTSDVANVTAAIAALNPRERPGSESDCPYLTPYFAYVLANQIDYEALVAKEDEMKSCDPEFQPVASGRGRGAKANSTPMPNWQDPIALVILRTARQIWQEQENASKDTLDTIESVVDLLAAQPGQRMLLLGSGGFLAGTLQIEQGTLITRAVHANVTINSLDAKGLYTYDAPTRVVPGGVMGVGSTYAAKIGTRPKDATNDVMESLSAGTGGKFFRNSNDLEGGFEELTEIPEVSYLLGFSPPNPDGKFHRLKVQAPGVKGYTIEARLGYMSVDESPNAPPKQERKIDREVFTAGQSHDAPVGLDLTYEPAASGGNILRAVFHADVRTLPFVEQAGVRSERLSFLVALLDQDGNFVTGKEGAMDFALKQPTFERLQGTRLDASLQLEMPPAGTYRLRVLIEEGNGGKLTEATRAVQVK
jgi:VWFA-related protein